MCAHELRGHEQAVHALAAVPAADGRVLLASGDRGGSVRLWDPQSGDPAGGPVQVDEDFLTGLAAVQLRSGAWALVCCGDGKLTRWDPLAMSRDASPAWKVDVSRALTMAAVPATAAAPGLVVTNGWEGVCVIDPEDGRALFRIEAAEDPLFLRLAAGPFGDGRAGVAIVRYGHDMKLRDMELWAPGGDAGTGEWRRRDLSLDGSDLPDAMTFLTGADGEPLLACATRYRVDVWNIRTNSRVARAEFDVMINELAPVPLGERVLLALGYSRGEHSGVRLWDPHTRHLVGEAVNLHGPGFGDRQRGNAEVHALTAVTGPDGSVRVASASGGVVRMSAPLDPNAPAEGASEEKIRITSNTETRAATVPAAIQAFLTAIEATPVIDDEGLQEEYAHLRDAWKVKGLVSGSLDEITAILRTNLELDAERSDGAYFLIDFLEYERCTQVNAMGGGGFGPYRVWRTTDGFSMYSNRQLLARQDANRPLGKLRRWLRRQ